MTSNHLTSSIVFFEASVAIAWTGNLGEGTANYRAYSRNHEIRSSRQTYYLLLV
ncbi:hypothetical protein [Scytonema sp. NUACC26]|uniref:hypothetical protein n=1 Tax=Scytonema sp. NUACC26 TaxID=3140176 RepID=UPI0038B35531